MTTYNKQNKRIKIAEIVGDMKINYSSVYQVGNINHTNIYQHINKGETDFICEGEAF